MKFPSQLSEAVSAHPSPLLFATVSGAHLYGFPSPDSDWDLRGVHVLSAREVLSLHPLQDTVSIDRMEDGVELDLVTHDARKFIELMLRPNGYVLEQLHSPLVVHTSPDHAELIMLGRQCVTRFHAHHYLGFSAGQWKLLHKPLERGELPELKPLLYTFRTLLTGIHLMRTGDIEANLVTLNAEYSLPFLDDLIARKQGGREHEPVGHALDIYEADFRRLTTELEAAREATHLPATTAPETRAALSELLVRLRLGDQA